MNKETFLEILECALLNFDGVSFEELTGKNGLDSVCAEVGIKLCTYIKTLEIKIK